MKRCVNMPIIDFLKIRIIHTNPRQYQQQKLTISPRNDRRRDYWSFDMKMQIINMMTMFFSNSALRSIKSQIIHFFA